ncbi:uncharacterized protein LOC117569902 [Drosophila albomicans]|uniref:Uncharacterized protein LOC117569902 n=1 Tax=Drosophila albomicans TaxID=7291 RepID=A0A6P8X0L9_DROAB|nr:uncharacterized protein LOC117569902 [Drosophila albomicans]
MSRKPRTSSKQRPFIHGASLLLLLLLLSLLQFTSVSCYGDHIRSRLTKQAEQNLEAITGNAVIQATEVIDGVVDDLLILDSQNSKMLDYLSSCERYLAVSHNHTKETLEFFYDIVDDYLDSDAAEKTTNIETQLIAFCLQRNGFDRWKRTVQLRTNQLLKSFGKKIHKYAESLDKEERLVLEHHWKLVSVRNGQRKLEKFRDFISWLAR